MEDHEEEARARQRELVRRGYDAISEAYRGDDGRAGASGGDTGRNTGGDTGRNTGGDTGRNTGGDTGSNAGGDTGRYAGWVGELAGLLPAGARVADLGCGNGIPATRELCVAGLRVTGVDFSGVQLRRARRLVPGAALVQADMARLAFAPASLDAVVSFYALIHLPLADQRALIPRIRTWLRPGGLLLAIVGAQPYTGTERFLGADMFWEHAGTASYLGWLEEAGFTTRWDRYVPEGDSGHSLILAEARHNHGAVTTAL